MSPLLFAKQTRALLSMRNRTGSWIPLITKSSAIVKKTRAPGRKENDVFVERKKEEKPFGVSSFK